jgi:hypothetical protein
MHWKDCRRKELSLLWGVFRHLDGRNRKIRKTGVMLADTSADNCTGSRISAWARLLVFSRFSLVTFHMRSVLWYRVTAETSWKERDAY